MAVYNFADIAINIHAYEWLMIPSFKEFESKSMTGLVNWYISFEDIPSVNNTRLLVSLHRKSYYERKGETSILFPKEDDVLSMITSDSQWKNCSFYLRKKFNNLQDPHCVQLAKDYLLAAITEAFTVTLALRNGLHIHSAAIDWEGNGIVFSAPSGIGKSTHVHLWQELSDVRILDGDVSACRIINGRTFVFGLPWCGTSGEYFNGRAPLKAFVFLEQAEENHIERLGQTEAIMRLVSNSFLPFWSEHLMGLVLDTAEELTNTVDCYLLRCRPDYEAVEMVKQCIVS